MTENSALPYEPHVHAKRVYLLAYQRASATLRKRHREEFEHLVKTYRNNLVAEEMMTGGIDRAPRGGRRTHVPVASDGDGDVCAHCAGAWPCATARARERAREREQARRNGGADE